LCWERYDSPPLPPGEREHPDKSAFFISPSLDWEGLGEGDYEVKTFKAVSRPRSDLARNFTYLEIKIKFLDI